MNPGARQQDREVTRTGSGPRPVCGPAGSGVRNTAKDKKYKGGMAGGPPPRGKAGSEAGVRSRDMWEPKGSRAEPPHPIGTMRWEALPAKSRSPRRYLRGGPIPGAAHSESCHSKSYAQCGCRMPDTIASMGCQRHGVRHSRMPTARTPQRTPCAPRSGLPNNREIRATDRLKRRVSQSASFLGRRQHFGSCYLLRFLMRPITDQEAGRVW